MTQAYTRGQTEERKRRPLECYGSVPVRVRPQIVYFEACSNRFGPVSRCIGLSVPLSVYSAFLMLCCERTVRGLDRNVESLTSCDLWCASGVHPNSGF